MSADVEVPRRVPEPEGNEWLPEHCPPWCEGGHAQALVEGNGWESSQQHFASGGGDSFDEIRNQIDHRVIRPGGGGWDLTARCTPFYGGGSKTATTINLEIHDQQDKRVDAAFTTGEARVLARQLIALADKIDLPS
jgi:hypothetical protein